MKQIRIDPHTSAVSPLDMFFNETHLSSGTAFFWRGEQDHTFLVTNWHNFTGKDPFTGKHLSANASEPNRITFDVFEQNDLNRRKTVSVSLFNDDLPVWLEHPIHGNRVDVVCMEIDIGNLTVFPINDLTDADLAVRVAYDVFLLGYPMGINTSRLPVWKRGSIASEPDINVDKLPMFLVDSATA